MSETARVGKTTLWYDGPIAFEVHRRGHTGEAMAYDQNETNILYTAYFASAEVDAMYRARRIDLLTLMTDPATERFHFTDKDMMEGDIVTLHTMKAPFTDQMLPESGLYFGDL